VRLDYEGVIGDLTGWLDEVLKVVLVFLQGGEKVLEVVEGTDIKF